LIAIFINIFTNAKNVKLAYKKFSILCIKIKKFGVFLLSKFKLNYKTWIRLLILQKYFTDPLRNLIPYPADREQLRGKGAALPGLHCGASPLRQARIHRLSHAAGDARV